MVPTATIGDGLLDRGVWVLPVTGPNDEVVLVAVRANHALVSEKPTFVPKGSDHVAAAEALLDLLDLVDPVPVEKNHARRRFEMRIV